MRRGAATGTQSASRSTNGGRTLVADTSGPTLAWKDAVVASLDKITERIDSGADRDEQMTFALERLNDRMTTVEKALSDGRAERRALPGEWRGWAQTAIMLVAVAISVLALVGSHITFH